MSANEAYKTDMKLRIAITMVERFGLLTGSPDGEDTAGRRAWKIEDPAEVARRATDIAEETVKAIDRKGWISDAIAEQRLIERIAAANRKKEQG